MERSLAKALQKRTGSFAEPEILFLPGGEANKRLEQVERLADQMLERGADRTSIVIGFGGGIVTDLGGFLAAIFMRGIPVLQVPTTLLAQVDAAVGGKTGVNLANGKNLLGSFHQPLAVLIDPELTATLPEREFRAGLFEIVKCGVIRDRGMFDLMATRPREVLSMNAALVDSLIAGAVRVKAEVVSADERESGLRRILNYGHTIGHAIESETGYVRFLHGEAVARGMLAATHLAVLRGMLPTKEAAAILETIQAYGPLPSAIDLDPEHLLGRLEGGQEDTAGQDSLCPANAHWRGFSGLRHRTGFDSPRDRRLLARGPMIDPPPGGSEKRSQWPAIVIVWAPSHPERPRSSRPREWVRTMFEDVAPKYDFLNHVLSFNVDRLWRKRLLRSCAAHSGQDQEAKVLDLCCGTGDVLLELQQATRNAVLGADFCHPMLVTAREKIGRRSFPSLVFEGDALTLPLRDESLDLLTIAFGFRNLANYEAGLNELRRVLKPGGMLAILEFSHPRGLFVKASYGLYSKVLLPAIGGMFSGSREAYEYLPASIQRFPRAEQLRDMMSAAGFSDARFELLSGGIAALHTGKKAS